MLHVEQAPNGRWIVCYPDGTNADGGQTYATFAAARRALCWMTKSDCPTDKRTRNGTTNHRSNANA